jgi:uncharacterized protein YbcV (DUF1398 family)
VPTGHPQWRSPHSPAERTGRHQGKASNARSKARGAWFLPACQSLYLTGDGPVVTLGTPLVSGTTDVPPFDREALIAALRTDQAGESTFFEFLAASWRAGVVRYDVDLKARTVAYHGCHGEEYTEDYPAVEVG